MEKKKKIDSLYLTYDGLLDPLGQSQVLPYVEGFARKGLEVCVVSFEKREAWHSGARRVCEKRLASLGIEWISLRYHKWPPVLSTLFDVLQGLAATTGFCRRKSPVVVHARGYVVSLVALWVKRLSRAKFLFDMRGFWAEERLEGGLSSNPFLYRATKWWEKRFFEKADGIVVLSHVAKDILEDRFGQNGGSRPVRVIPTCTDLRKFSPRQMQDPSLRWNVAYVGSVGTWYLMPEMIQFFKILQEFLSEAHWAILTPRHDPLLEEWLRELDPSSYSVQRLMHEEVPGVLNRMQASLCFIKPGGSKRASCPTKVGESLACGVPVVITRDVGDCDRLIAKENVGVVVSDLSEASYRTAADQLLALQKDPELAKRCRRVAKEYFDLEQGVEKYLSFYEKVLRER